MLYAYIAAAIVVFGLGFGAGYKVESDNVKKLEVAIASSNAEAELTLKVAQDKVAEADKHKAAMVMQLEKAHEQAVITANGLSEQLDNAVSLYATSGQDRCDPVPKRVGAAVPKRPAASDNRAAGLVELASRTAKQCDEVSEYAQLCYQFVASNCGVEP